MPDKQTYEELAERVQNLEEEALKYKHMEKLFKEKEARLRSILRAVPIGIGVDATG